MKMELSSIMSLFASGSLAFTAAITQSQSNPVTTIGADTGTTRIAQTSGDESSGGNFESLFRTLDADGDGNITREEFRKGAVFLGTGTVEPSATGTGTNGKTQTGTDDSQETNDSEDAEASMELL